MARILQTKNYDLFRPHSLTREIKEGTRRYLVLESSILRSGWWPTEPMVVLPRGRDGKHVITKGHHRWKIAQKHNLSVYYVIDEQQIAITDREDSGGKPQWSQSDWITSHLKDDKNPNYRILMSFHERTGIPMSSCIDLYMAGVKGAYTIDTGREVRAGTLRVADTTFAEKVGDIVVFCGDLGVSYCRKTGFIRSIALIVKTKVVPLDELKKKIKQNISIMKKKSLAHTQDYLSVINEAYNFRTYPKMDLRTEIQNRVSEEKKAAARAAVAERERKKSQLLPPVSSGKMAASGKE
jgi:hypothetical protein